MGFTRTETVIPRRIGSGDLALATAITAAMLTTSGSAATNRSLDGADLEHGLQHARQLSRAFQTVAAGVAPSVVSIEVTDNHPYHQAGGGPGGMRAVPGAQLPPRQGGATGVVIDADGLIVTNNHVVEGADEILVEFHDGTRVAGTVVGKDMETDLAVIRVEEADLVPARFGDSNAAEVGEWILAVGSPFGLNQTVTAGIISAVGRDEMGLARYESFIQTDAAINPGNSGGPLVNLDGEVIGINTAIRSSSGGSNGIGFAIPSSIVNRVSTSIVRSGRVERGWLGITVQPMNEELARTFGYEGGEAVLVSSVIPHTPAEEVGLTPGDIITSIGGQPTENPIDLVREIGRHDPDSELSIEYVREGTTRVVSARLIERPRDLESFLRGTSDETSIGLLVREIEEEDIKDLELASDRGVLVEGVEGSGPADRAGLQPGDVIRRVDGTPMSSVDEFQQVIRKAVKAGEVIRMLVERENLTQFILVDPDAG